MDDIQILPVGFDEDVKKLVVAFVERDTSDFTVFKALWHEHNFSSIYRGRDAKEIDHFTQEVFQLTLKFLDRTNDLYQIACVYILFCLYKAQIQNPPLRIRLTLSHANILKSMQKTAFEKNYKHLLVIIEFLYKEAFEFVAYSTLHGPRSLHFRKEMNFKPDFSAAVTEEAKRNLFEIRESGVLENISTFCSAYTNFKATFFDQLGTVTTDSFPADFANLKKELDKLVGKPKSSSKVDYEIGLRRTQIKTAAFQHKSKFKTSIFATDQDDSEEEETLEEIQEHKKPLIIRRRRLPQSERKIGRPSKAMVEARQRERFELMKKKKESPVKKPKMKRGPIGRPRLDQQRVSDDELHEEKPLSIDQITQLSDSSSSEEVDSPLPVTCKEENGE